MKQILFSIISIFLLCACNTTSRLAKQEGIKINSPVSESDIITAKSYENIANSLMSFKLESVIRPKKNKEQLTQITNQKSAAQILKRPIKYSKYLSILNIEYLPEFKNAANQNVFFNVKLEKTSPSEGLRNIEICNRIKNFDLQKHFHINGNVNQFDWGTNKNSTHEIQSECFAIVQYSTTDQASNSNNIASIYPLKNLIITMTYSKGQNKLTSQDITQFKKIIWSQIRPKFERNFS